MIRVLVVDDSAVLRQSTRFILEKDPELKVVGEARNGEEAIALAQRLGPDVVTMDIRMPKMDGFEAIRHIMAEKPVPIVVVTSADLDREIGVSSQAIKAGAVSVLRRPMRISDPEYKAFTARLVGQVKLMSDVKVVHRPMASRAAPPRSGGPRPATVPRTVRKIEIVSVGSSTGGPAALHQMLGGLPADFSSPILIVQHIAFGFVEGLAGWLDGACELRVKVAEPGERVQPGSVYVAPDDQHMEIGYGRIRLNQAEPVSGHRPSVTPLFESVARSYGPAAMGVIMTGMGADGAVGMKTLREAGAITIAQDEESCVVFGMPKEAIALGAIQRIVPLEKIAQVMVALCRRV
ncbi:MAG: chemotaxis response regulator protein-glutamate methylesterase [Chloroflexota bacterium]|nr:chemotaxis response regulator protein-glutamate methylesterase [Chloroflexota bacterium]